MTYIFIFKIYVIFVAFLDVGLSAMGHFDLGAFCTTLGYQYISIDIL
jgi:hypothetical protein